MLLSDGDKDFSILRSMRSPDHKEEGFTTKSDKGFANIWYLFLLLFCFR